MSRILITGSEGLIGSALRQRLIAVGHEVVSFDIAALEMQSRRDVTDYRAVARAMAGCTGVVHLAAVSRVILGERDPQRCSAVNIAGTRNVLDAAVAMGRDAPWVLVASSREVYGQAVSLPVKESDAFRPLNVYARSKVEVERCVAHSRFKGLMASVVRFSSVYGSNADYADRVAPAFARLAAHGGVLRIDGAQTTLDFTHIDDVAAALEKATALLSARDEPMPPLHLVSGRGVTISELARIAIAAAGSGSIELGPPRPYDVTSFVGDPTRARDVLGWQASIAIEEGIARLVEDFRLAVVP